MANYNVTVNNIEETLRRARKEALGIAEDDFTGRVKQTVKSLIQATPIDTGLARQSWDYTIKQDQTGYYAIITNGTDYIEYLNRGHSQQAPSYFIEQVLAAVGELKGDAVKFSNRN